MLRAKPSVMGQIRHNLPQLHINHVVGPHIKTVIFSQYFPFGYSTYSVKTFKLFVLSMKCSTGRQVIPREADEKQT